MKQLQHNFTTPEQSKRLIELGVPADSADCYHNVIAGKPFLISYGTLFSDPRHQFSKGTLPCWSAGRLMEIYLTCAMDYHPYDDFYTETPSLHFMAFDKDRLIETIIELFEQDEMDFSKLEN